MVSSLTLDMSEKRKTPHDRGAKEESCGLGFVIFCVTWSESLRLPELTWAQDSECVQWGQEISQSHSGIQGLHSYPSYETMVAPRLWLRFGSLSWATGSQKVYFPILLLVWPTQGSSNWRSTVDTLRFCRQAARVQISAVSIWLAYITSWKSCYLSVICRKGDDGKKTTQQSWYKDSLDSLVNYYSSEFAEQAAWLIPGPCGLAHRLARSPPGCFGSAASLAPLEAQCKEQEHGHH